MNYKYFSQSLFYKFTKDRIEMDTRYWGPSGWRLLHLVTFGYEPKQKKEMLLFLQCLPFVLPCKFCRSSLITYYEDLPPEDHLQSKESVSKWMWKIHSKVNEKLRSQGQTIPPDPTYAMVKKIYTERLAYGCTKVEFPGWDFLFSIVENHPLAKGDTSTPMPNAPPLETIDPSNHKELLKWNYLESEIRYSYLCTFWKSLPAILPFPEWKLIWNGYRDQFCDTTLSNKQASLKTLWNIRCSINKELHQINKTSFRALCNDLKVHKSGCAKSRNARTCRKKRKH